MKTSSKSKAKVKRTKSPRWISGLAESNGRNANTCSECGMAVANFAETKHEQVCWHKKQ